MEDFGFQNKFFKKKIPRDRRACALRNERCSRFCELVQLDVSISTDSHFQRNRIQLWGKWSAFAAICQQ
jgi:hypothetical protein